MSSFTTPLVVSPLPDGRHWRLVLKFGYDVGRKGSNDRITVPAGFITDFASSPPPIWWLIPSWGKYGKAAVIHDYLYQHRTRTRKEADNILREAMLVLNVAPWRVSLIYRGVRMFGWLAWRRRKVTE